MRPATPASSTLTAAVMPEEFHALPVEATLAVLGTSANGLTDAEAARRLAEVGPNRLERHRPASAFAILLDQARSTVVWLLAAVAVVSLGRQDWIDAAAVLAVLTINTVLGFVTELGARRSMEALVRYEGATAMVTRAGGVRGIDAADLVPGDLLHLDPGRAVPADARLVATTDLQTDDASLTGESLPTAKSAEANLPPDTPLGDRTTMVYLGTTVTGGTALAVVTATGPRTELGRIGTLIDSVRETTTPLERRLDDLARRLVWFALAVAGVVGLLGAWQGHSWSLSLETALALAVAAVPEALPAVATIALAVGVRRMARRRALVRRLPAVEALGSVTVVCSDKTRTLTSGDMTLVRVWTADGEGPWPPAGAPPDASRAALVHEAAAAARAHQPGDDSPSSGDPSKGLAGLHIDPVDRAVMSAALHAAPPGGRPRPQPSAGHVPFSSLRQFTAGFRPGPDGGLVAAVKGAPGAVLGRCRTWKVVDGPARLDAAARARILEANDAMARDALRVLAVAAGPVAAPREQALSDLCFLGLIGFIDPPAPGVEDAVRRIRRAGLRILVLTGDQRATAVAIGRAIGLVGGDSDAAALDGRGLDQLSDADLAGRVGEVAIFGRVSPAQKLRVVRALQARGDVVAMLGDGVNDAAALKQADVGVAMGRRGTDVAKQAAVVVLQDDRFETIAAAIEEGRVIDDNIRKFVFYLFSCNLAEVLVLLLAGLAGLGIPLQPLQILWLNLVTDTFPALALALEPRDVDIMERPPRPPQAPLISRPFVTSLVAYASVITVCTLAAYLIGLRRSPAAGSTMSFMTLALAQILHLGNARSAAAVLHPSRALANPYAIAAVGLAAVLQLTAAFAPAVSAVLGVAPLSWPEWAVVAAAAALPAVGGQAAKLAGAGWRSAPDVNRGAVG